MARDAQMPRVVEEELPDTDQVSARIHRRDVHEQAAFAIPVAAPESNRCRRLARLRL
jgi:hypothetical protein